MMAFTVTVLGLERLFVFAVQVAETALCHCPCHHSLNIAVCSVKGYLAITNVDQFFVYLKSLSSFLVQNVCVCDDAFACKNDCCLTI
jgi:hypothetical protein